MGELLLSAMFWTKTSEGFYIYEELPPEPQKIERTYTRPPSRTRTRSRAYGRSRYKNKTTIVFAPHPDDEILCCSSKIGEKIGKREKVKVVVITDGDAYEKERYNASRRYGVARRKESKQAAEKLGLRSSDVMFLGFPDGMLDKLNEVSLKSPYTNFFKTPWGSHVSRAPYTRAKLEEILSQILAKYRPNEIFIPSQNDYHPDHQVVGQIIKDIVADKNMSVKTFEYVVHQPKRIVPEDAKVNWKKLKLISIFESQFHDRWHREFLEQFARIPEKFNLVEFWNQTARR